MQCVSHVTTSRRRVVSRPDIVDETPSPALRNVHSFQGDPRDGHTTITTLDKNKKCFSGFFCRFMPFLHLLLLIVRVCMCVLCVHACDDGQLEGLEAANEIGPGGAFLHIVQEL